MRGRQEADMTHHYLHGTPARRAPVHRHSLVNHVGHRSHRLCKPSEQTDPNTYNCLINIYLQIKSTKGKQNDFSLMKDLIEQSEMSLQL